MFAYLKAKLFGLGVLQSKVPGHKGPCYPTWLNENQFLRRMEGPGVSGFYKLLSGGEEFPGIAWLDGNVWSSMGVYSTFRGPDNTKSTLHCETCTGADLECPECHGEGQTVMSVRERSLLTLNG